MADALVMLGLIWLLHALAAGGPVILAWLARVTGSWRMIGAALLIVPFWGLIGVQGIWPVGGASSFIVRVGLLTFVVFVAEAFLLLPAVRKGPAWSRVLLLSVAIVSVVPNQLSVPALPD